MSAASEVRGLLARLGWVLRRRASVFAVSRAGESRALCEFAIVRASGAGRSLTPGARLQAAPRPGARLKAGEKEGLAKLSSALDLLLESKRGESPAPARGTALAESHEGHEGRDLLLRTTFACNQKCLFCFVPMTGKGADFAEIERELDAQAGRFARAAS